ncbi:MAG: DNA-3-methyladenine glycosylase I [Melioribacteraceae bacterium]|nr:DNA-3-methyladenine glycosylase I [Melioribacteraceae bacterium]
MQRCPWCGDDPLYVKYHDTVWGVPEHNDRKLFAKLCLDGAQAGLSWITILRKEKNYNKAFDNFDAKKMANYNQKKIDELLNNPGIIRNKLKVNAFITNAQSYLQVKKEFGSFDKYIWHFSDFKTVNNKFKSLKEVPAKTPLAEEISKDLKKRGFKFVGPTIVYAFMQAIGMVNDHLIDCFRYKAVQKLH